MAEANSPSTSDCENTEVPQEDSPTMAETNCPTGMDRFLQKTRSELMYELRQIQHGERPVTGQNRRENINQFFTKHLEAPAGSEGKENVPANVDAVEEHRPESVVVEVEGLYEQRRVSSVLQSTAFRRSLERIIRGSITTASQRPQATPSHLPPHRRTSRGQEQSSENGPSTASTDQDSRVPSPPEMRLTPPAASPTSQPTGIVAPNEMPTWQSISEIHHEEIVQEISQLLHRRLVSSTLDGEFRGTLEVQMQNHVDSSGGNGEAVAQAVRSLPNPGVIRNDFSHLGLGQDLFEDNISVTSISATAVPYTQSNLHLSREISSLKSQMEEMKNMLKLSFDLQLDIQRAIRQEVAAAVSQATGATAAPPATATLSHPVSDTHCLICLENHSDTVLYQCGHMCLCYACGKHLMSQSGKCPVCRAPIKDIIRAYKCNTE
ncbi:uncharacterized protein [Haliotis cracherodii]|uniref:uncharacterized protein isoform X2 n=1 Tax=Haliotis cracherodii TaxID=6455 RepID=UPI0039ED14B3